MAVGTLENEAAGAQSGRPAGISAVIGAAASVVERFHAARAAGDARAMDEILHPVWTKTEATSDGRILTLARGEMVEQAKTRGSGAADRAIVSSALHCRGDLVVVRTDEPARPSAAFHYVFYVDGAWRIAGQAEADAASGARDAVFSARMEEAAVLAVLERYYRAVVQGDPAALDRIFAACWLMRNHELGAVVAEGVEAFAQRLAPGPLPDYGDDRQIADVQIVYDRLAFVRVDRPTALTITAFAFMKIKGAWRVIDKLWTDQSDCLV